GGDVDADCGSFRYFFSPFGRSEVQGTDGDCDGIRSSLYPGFFDPFFLFPFIDLCWIDSGWLFLGGEHQYGLCVDRLADERKDDRTIVWDVAVCWLLPGLRWTYIGRAFV